MKQGEEGAGAVRDPNRTRTNWLGTEPVSWFDDNRKNAVIGMDPNSVGMRPVMLLSSSKRNAVKFVNEPNSEGIVPVMAFSRNCR